MVVYAIIPARGGSKSIPRKNVRPFAGVPLICHTIRAATSADCVRRTIVTTDDAEIAAISRAAGAEVVMRPEELANDTAKSEDALTHCLRELEKQGPLPDVTVFLQCTSPLIQGEHIDAVISQMRDENADSAFSAARTHVFLWENEDGHAKGVNHDEAHRPRRQDRRAEFAENGAIYAMRTDGLLAHNHRFFGKTIVVDTPGLPALEIDDPSDFDQLEAIFLARARAESAEALPKQIDLIAFDFDGVMTDDRVFVDQNGTESVACSRSDGMGIERLRKAGFESYILSKETNPVVRARGEKLGIPVFHGVENKAELLDKLLTERDIPSANVVFVGNDLNDLECMAKVGCAVAPADARPEARAAAHIVLTGQGGRGAVRELSDLILRYRPR
jgi:YrbI family 3-deoxy-D-manno-octulosonate 8-phosphate phosphatase